MLLLAFALVLWVYWPGAHGPWLFDDHSNLLENRSLPVEAEHFDAWRSAAVSSGSGILRRPLAMFSFALNSAWSGELDSVAVKQLNVIIHGLCGLLLFFFFRSLLLSFSDRGGGRGAFSTVSPGSGDVELLAGFAALLWLAHPLQVSTVLYAVQRMAQLSTLFVFLGLWYFTAHRRLWAERGASWGELLFTALWLGLITLLAVLSKENGALLPALILVVEVCIFRGCWAGRINATLVRLAWGLLLLPLALLVMVGLLWPEVLQAGYGSRDFSLYERLLTQGRVLWTYVSWLLVPSIDAMGLHHDDVVISTRLLSPPWPLLAWAGWLLALVVAWLLRQRIPLLLFAALFFLVGQSMESTVLPLEMAFEHRNYLPSAGLMLAAVWLIRALFAHLHKPAAGLLIITILYCALLGLTFIRVGTWQDEIRLAQVNATNHPASVRANGFYANTLLTLAESPAAQTYDAETRGQWLWQARQHYAAIQQIDPADFGRDSPDRSGVVVVIAIAELPRMSRFAGKGLKILRGVIRGVTVLSIAKQQTA